MGRWFNRGIIRDMKLFHKMIFFYIAIVFIPTLVISFFYIGRLSQDLNQKYIQGREELMGQAQSFIENKIAQVRYCNSAIQYNYGVNNYVRQYDFSTGEGTVMWMEYVKPVFEQLKIANPDFTEICIWRINAMAKNDPRYVLNASDNEYLPDIEPLSYQSMKIVFNNTEEHTECVFYSVLYNNTIFRKIGYVQVNSDFDYIFSALRFMDPADKMFLTCGSDVYQVLSSQQGNLYLVPCEEKSGDEKRSITIDFENIGVTLNYRYSQFNSWDDSSLLVVAIGVLLLLVFFTIVYYLFYRLITKRITNLTAHMLSNQEELLVPCADDPSRDEIGTMIRVYNQTVRRVNAMVDELLQKQRLVNQAQYYAMQSQIHPHFLYNTLENIDMLIELGENEKASSMMAAFGRILRYNLSRRQELATIGEEMKHIEDYLKLYSFRMADDFEYHISMDPECENVSCPYCMLQPIVENCFKHGFVSADEKKWVQVRAWIEDDFVIIEVEDNGEGISEERFDEITGIILHDTEPKKGESVGLGNVHERIKLLCGERSGLWVEKKTGGCRINIAIRIEGGDHNGIKDFNCG